MSRIGKKPIDIKTGITIKIEDNIVKVKGPKGELSERLVPEVSVKSENNQLIIERKSEDKRSKSMHGLFRSLINNMVVGVSEGYSKKLEIVGVGYKAEAKGKGILLALGYSHPIYFIPPAEIKIEVPTPTSLVVSGINKQLVGLVSAKLRSLRPPEPYKGKGVRYEKEHILRKAGKQAGK